MFFHALTFAGSLRTLFEHEAVRPSAQTLFEALGTVNAMQQKCVIVILAYFI